jgi:hypothetical protein
MTDEQMIEHIKAVQTQYTDQLMSLPNVIGVSIGQREPDEDRAGDYVIVVLVDRLVDHENVAVKDQIPRELDGVPIIVRQIGTFEAL